MASVCQGEQRSYGILVCQWPRYVLCDCYVTMEAV